MMTRDYLYEDAEDYLYEDAYDYGAAASMILAVYPICMSYYDTFFR